jgi:cytochrome c biogenesis protein CcmG/thiol:disulfide interchange protein DsbE
MKQLVALVLAFVLAGGVSFAQKSKPAPNFKLIAYDGNVVELAKLKGKVVVVNFWATWCGPCRQEIPGFMDFHTQYKEKGVVVVGVSLDQDGWEVVKPYVERTKINYPVVVDDGSLAEAYEIPNAIPATYVVDKKGNIAKSHIGFMTKSQLEGIIKPLL